MPQPSWSSDKEEALVSFLLLCSTSHFWTSRRTDVSLGTNPSLVQYQRGLLASLVCWYCELAALLTARLTLLSSSITPRFCWVSSQRYMYIATYRLIQNMIPIINYIKEVSCRLFLNAETETEPGFKSSVF